MGIKVLENLLTKTAKPNVLDGLLTYRSSNKELKDVINHRIYTENPELFHGKYDGALLGEGGSATIPRIHVDDLKHYLGDLSSDIPTRYKRSTGNRDIDQLATMAGYDDIDNYVDAIQTELSSRSQQRSNNRLLSEIRNDPKFIEESQNILNKEKSYYADNTQEMFEPNKRDHQWYMKNVVIPKSVIHQIPVKTPYDGLENFAIKRNDTSPIQPGISLNYTPSMANIPVRNLSKSQQQPILSNMLSSEDRYIPQQNTPTPSWRELMANMMAVRTGSSGG